MSRNGKQRGSPTFAPTESLNSSYTTTSLDQQQASIYNQLQHPTFDIEPVQLQFNINHKLNQLLVENDIMYLLLDHSTLYKIDLDNPSQVKKYQIPTVGTGLTKVQNIWLHPNGFHLIVQTNDFNYFYLNNYYTSFKPLPKFKGINITQIAFPRGETDPSMISSGGTSSTIGPTETLLIGAQDGTIYLGSIKPHDPTTQDKKRDDKYLKSVFKLDHPLQGLTFSNNKSQINMVSNNKLYTWDCFDTSYNELIKVFKSTSPQITPLSLSKSKSRMVFATNSQEFIIFDPISQDLYSNDQEIQLSQVDNLSFSEGTLHEILLTDHHLVGLTHSSENLVIFNKLALTKPPIKLNLKQFISPGERIHGITADYSSHTYWLYTENSIFELVIQNESISIWYDYYKIGKYVEALKCLENQENNFFKKDLVLIKQGYELLQKGGFGVDYTLDVEDKNDREKSPLHDDFIKLQVKGINILAKSTEPFEKICLMLLDISSHSKLDAVASSSVSSLTLIDNSSSLLSIISERLLVEYLLVKYSIAKDIERNQVRMVVLSSWIVELTLRVIHRLENELSKDKVQTQLRIHKENFLDQLNQIFQEFINKNYKHLDPATVYEIMNDMNCKEKLLYYAELIEDYEFILKYYIDIRDWKNSNKVIIKIYSSSKMEDLKELIYKYSTVLLLNYPKGSIDSWLRLSSSQDISDTMDFDKFLPAILTYCKSNSHVPIIDNYAIQFMQKIIYEKGYKSKQLNNYYLSLLITYKNQESKSQINKQITKFINYAALDTKSKKSQLYDVYFILRLCISHQAYQPAIFILIQELNLFDQALELALNNDLINLGEFVLTKYDEYINKNKEVGILKYNEENDHYYAHGDDDNHKPEEDFLNRIKLEEASYSERKKLWLRFSKHLIEWVCKGRKVGIPVIDDEDEGDSNEIKEPTRKDSKESNPIKGLTNDIANSITGASNQSDKDAINALQVKKLNKVLTYILQLSNSGTNTNNVLGLKDLLPLFPETIMINNFKDEIVNSLNQYNNKINQLSMEMKESLTISSKLKQQVRDSTKITNQAKIYSIIEPGEPCHLCNKLLVGQNFIFFPNCHHGFHKECLMRNYFKLPNLNYKFKKIYQSFKRDPSVVNKRELDDILTKECILCNEMNINLCDNGLIDYNKDQEEMKHWEL
ncbi:PEP3 [[Candida] subhashii]|uniref:PEP3 n=1 Tax=[Candida] subhashii TaxID=561895 RepID=A0A8J5QEY9_9ASCO|nr:PEP3 [[Candida] subhashii]KAG7660398.1 PEP3 [[Candida] subhashii]